MCLLILKYSKLTFKIGLGVEDDDRVVPAHSFKMAATLQHTLAENPNPLLIRIDVKSGHGGGKPTAKVIEEACQLSFFK